MSERRDVPAARDDGEMPDGRFERDSADAAGVESDAAVRPDGDPPAVGPSAVDVERAEPSPAEPAADGRRIVETTDPDGSTSSPDSNDAATPEDVTAPTDPRDPPRSVAEPVSSGPGSTDGDGGPAISTDPVPDDPTPPAPSFPVTPVGLDAADGEPSDGDPRLPRWARIALRAVAVAAVAFLLGYAAVALLFFPVGGEGEIVAAPDLRGRSVEDAERMADDVGLRAERGSAIPSPAVPAGAVVAQSPLPGREMARGARIRLVVSQGPRRAEVPSVDGLRAAEARALLERVGFTVEVREARSPRGRGRVLEMEPEAGTSLALPATVRLTVSTGPPPVEVPSLVGRSLGSVRDVLAERGLRLGSVRFDPDAPGLLGDVAGQEPDAGEEVPRGTAVTVTVVGTSPTGFEIESEL